MGPIPVTERLPEPNTPQGDAFVLAYDAGQFPGWIAAVYRPAKGWSLDTSSISGYEWEAWEPQHITHWMPYPPAPETAVSVLSEDVPPTERVDFKHYLNRIKQ